MNNQIKKYKFTLTTPTAIIIGGIIIALAVIVSPIISKKSPTLAQNQIIKNNPQAQPAPQVDVSKVKIAGAPFIGNSNAPVTIAYWYDYQCPFCKRSEDTVMSLLIQDYVNTGKVKLVFKDFQFLGPDSQTAGLAERAVWEVAPNKFYEWHKAMYEKQDSENSGWGNKKDILALTSKVLGASDANKVAGFMITKANEYQQAMDADKTEGGQFGVTGTPAMIIGKQFLNGAQPYTSVKQAIDQELSRK